MYMKRMVEVGKAENGYVVECHVALKPEKKKEADIPSCCCCSSERQYIAKDAMELQMLLSKLLPALDTEYSSEDEFDSAFEKLTK